MTINEYQTEALRTAAGMRTTRTMTRFFSTALWVSMVNPASV